MKHVKPDAGFVVIEHDEMKSRKTFEVSASNNNRMVEIKSCRYEELLENDKNKMKDIVQARILDEIRGFESF